MRHGTHLGPLGISSRVLEEIGIVFDYVSCPPLIGVDQVLCGIQLELGHAGDD